MSALLELSNIRKSFNGLRVLDDVSLALAPGEVVSLLGPSGCGKSTLLRIAAGLDADFAGQLQRNPLLGFGPDGESGRGGGIGVVFQEPRLLPWLTVAQNVGFADGWLADDARIARLLHDVGLEGKGGLLPKQLSGGMAQRAAIARGLYGRPQVLLLDEPFSAVDAFTRLRLQDLIQDLALEYDISILLVTHDLDEAFYLGDRVLLLGGTPSRLRREFPVPLQRPRDRRAVELAYLRGEALTELQHSHVI
ncbi:ABC transporter ATP-binding protein [Pseudomonas sp. 273]|uniref:ABC transporter ATP-binding protein n=1 Tax=Pseudomonas sp. 273 TaxID=75692 RepID=UPI0023D86F9A|nr:ABC transporter ATP-binding protein [Pseudomonas sp. 273]